MGGGGGEREASQNLGEHTGFEMPLSASATLRVRPRANEPASLLLTPLGRMLPAVKEASQGNLQ